MLDAFKLTAILISGILWSAWLVLVLRKKDVHPLRDTLEGFSRLGWMKKVGVLFIVVQLTMFGGAKHGGTNDVDDVTSTNDVELVEGGTNTNEELRVESGELMMGQTLMSSTLHSSFLTLNSQSAAPYRLESVSTNEGYSYTMPASGAIRGTWHLTGAYEDVQKVTLDGFSFPLGSDLCTSLWAYTWGKVRPQLKNVSNEIAAVGAPMSAIPEVSRFWSAATSNDTYLLTWENFALGRIAAPTNASSLIPDPSSLVSAQVELFRNGDFITRSNDVESVWRRRMPCDLDEDGWIDLIDPDPMAFDEDGFGPHQTLPDGDNTNYYYRVDLVVDQANARVTFEGDDFSTLPDPDFIAHAGETNRVMLLIGKTYVVRCDLPIRCVGKEDDEVCVWNEGRTLGILWPIYLEFVPSEPLLLLAGPLLGAPSNGGGDTGVSVHPERAGGGSFSWENDFCCCSTSWDGSPVFCCDGTCGCGGCYTGDITYLIGGHGLIFGGWYCACSSDPDDPHEGDEPPDGPLAGPCVSATFSADVVIFEDEYENMPGQTIPRRSTETEVEFYAYGGTNGGTYAFSMVNESKLRRLGGAYLPKTGTVRAGESFRIKVRYEALSASGSEGDIKAKAEFTEFETNRKLPDVETPLTSVKVELETMYAATSNPDKHRHVYGIGEGVKYRTIPASVQSEWSFVAGANAVATYDWGGSTGNVFICPWTTDGLSGGSFSGSVTIHGCELNFSLSVVEPNIVALYPSTNIESSRVNPVYGEAGHLLMYLQMFVEPQYVSFKGIKIVEIPDESQSGVHWGYYNDRQKGGNWSHTANDGAGIWNEVGETGFYGVDRAGHSVSYSPPWINGMKVWQIPMGWGTGGDSVAGQFDPNPTTQTFSLTEDGTFTIRKFNHEATRNIHGSIWCE